MNRPANLKAVAAILAPKKIRDSEEILNRGEICLWRDNKKLLLQGVILQVAVAVIRIRCRAIVMIISNKKQAV